MLIKPDVGAATAGVELGSGPGAPGGTAAADVIEEAPMPRTAPGSHPFVRPRAGDQHEPELADLDLIAIGERGGLDAFPVHVRPVEAADIAHGKRGAVAVELRVATGDSH